MEEASIASNLSKDSKSFKKKSKKPIKSSEFISGNENNSNNNTFEKTEISTSSSSISTRKTWKIAIRKLPANKNYTKKDFEQNVQTVITALQLNPYMLNIEHFIEGKLSRKRGPIPSVGYLAFYDEHTYETFIQNCPNKIPFLTGKKIICIFFLIFLFIFF
jgi:hypothetical protein